MSERKLSPGEREILTFAATGHALVHSFMLIFPAVFIPLSEEFSLSKTEAGMLGTLSYFAFGFGALPAGFLTDKYGSKKLIMICLFGSAVSAFVVGAGDTFLTAALGLALLGAFAGIYHPAGLAMISKSIRNRPRALGYHGIAGNTGLAAAPIIAASLSTVGDWRNAYLLFGVMAFAAAVWFLLRPIEEDDLESIETRSSEKKTMFPEIIIFYAAAIVFGLVYRGALTYMPYLFTHKVSLYEGLSPVAVGGAVMTAALLVGMLGQWLGGKAGENYRLPPLLLFVTLLMSPALLLMGVFEQASLVAAAFVFTMITFAWQPVGNTLLAQYSSTKNRGKGYGINVGIAFGVGSFAAALCGYIAEKTSIGGVFIFLGILLVPGVLLIAWLWVLSNRRRLSI